MKPVSLFLMPHLVLLLTSLYGVSNSQLLLGATALNIIPLFWIVKVKKYKSHHQIYKCRATENFHNVELSDLRGPRSISQSSSENDEEDEIFQEVIQIESKIMKTLPEIPEENESDDEEDDISSKRMSKISMILQGFKGKDLTSSVTNLYESDGSIESLPETEDKKNAEIFDNNRNIPHKKENCFKFIIIIGYFDKLRQRLNVFLKETVFSSVARTLKEPYFYPALVSSTINTFISSIFVVSAPHIAIVKSMEQNERLPEADSVFLLTIIGFAWIFFLSGYPVVKKFTYFKMRILFLLGLLICAASMCKTWFILTTFSLVSIFQLWLKNTRTTI